VSATARAPGRVLHCWAPPCAAERLGLSGGCCAASARSLPPCPGPACRLAVVLQPPGRGGRGTEHVHATASCVHPGPTRPASSVPSSPSAFQDKPVPHFLRFIRFSKGRARARRLFLLDMLLGNADRLPCEALGWRGNAHNALYASAGRAAGRLVAIDSAVQRRPPGARGGRCAGVPPRAQRGALACRGAGSLAALTVIESQAETVSAHVPI